MTTRTLVIPGAGTVNVSTKGVAAIPGGMLFQTVTTAAAGSAHGAGAATATGRSTNAAAGSAVGTGSASATDVVIEAAAGTAGADSNAAAAGEIIGGENFAALVKAGSGAGGSLRRRRRRRPVDAIAALLLQHPWLAADGEHIAPVEGEVAGRAAVAFELRVEAAIGAVGEARLPSPIAVSVAGHGRAAPCGDCCVELLLTGAGDGRHDHFSDAELALLPLLFIG